MSDLMRTHRALCSSFVNEELFRRAFGAGRANIGTVARYLATPVVERPMLSFYFDAAFYRDTYPDLGDTAIDPLLHFIETGVLEERSPHPLVDVKYILSQDSGLLGNPPQIELLVDLLEYDLAIPSPYFDPAYYRAALGEAAPGNALLRHFLAEGLWARVQPNPWLDLFWYAGEHPELGQNPYDALRHFVQQGDAEGAAPSPAFDGRQYLLRNPDVAEAGMPPLRHFITQGREEGRAATPRLAAAPQHRTAPPEEVGLPLAVAPAEALARDAEMRRRVATMRQQRKDAVTVSPPSRLRSATPVDDIAILEFPAAPNPRVSILIPVYNELDVTVECLLALLQSMPEASFEVVVADDCSTDPEVKRLADVPNLVYRRQAVNAGFIGNCNDAFAACRGEYVLLLNNDTQVMPGAIDLLVAAMDADPAIGAAGPKLIYPDGRVQEAGCILKPNGESGMVGLFADPEEGGYCYDRDVPYCSGAALLVRRALVGETLFDPAFRPAYCEDADLCLRLIDRGYRIRFVAGAVVLHHLSVSSNRQSITRKLRTITRNQQTLSERWGGLLGRMNQVRTLAFYLPQFHPTPENDLWWGAGFTEWTNVTKARASYAGQYQPHLPADLGFYDLRTPDALRRQAELAARYGIDGFCVYYYNFGARRVLHKPIEVVRANPDIPFNWCLCWANENWTKHWDGGTREILLEQSYDDATLASIIADVVEQAADPRYLRVDGKPLFLLYRPLLLPDCRAFATMARRGFAAAGFPGVHLVYVESMEAVDGGVSPAELGFDAAVEFPPQGRAAPSETEIELLKEGWAGARFDYPETVLNFLKRDTVAYPRYPAVFPSWDNTARQPQRGNIFDGISPEAFRVYVEEKIEEVRAFHMGDERLLFVNAWNEWAEGTHLEPDIAYGHRWLEALRDAVAAKRWA
ncbi:MAG: glycoside hydrolase family 99-like domain-containing protein [Acetobacteraceae bacterium]|nr:glycoside hydrolase family 99-like domain-containing protein [Acetobacteraceae bacterium]